MAIVNETPQEKLIRELRQENERLKQLMDGRGGSSGQPVDEEARKEFLAQIEELKRAKEEAEKTMQERLQESEVRRNQTHVKVEVTTPHLMNLNEDPLLSGHIKHAFKPGESTAGRPSEGFVPDIPIQGLGVEERHCTFTNSNGQIRLIPSRNDTAKVLVNGKLTKGPVELKHEDRIRIGNHLFFLYVDPAMSRNPEVNWEFASREANELEVQGLLGAKEEELRRKMQEENEKAQKELDEERRKLEKLHADTQHQDELTRKQMEEKEREMRARNQEMIEEFKRKEMELKKLEQDLSYKKKVEEQLSQAFKLTNDASARAAMLGKKPRFKPEFYKAPGPNGRIGKGYEGTKVRMRVLLPELDDSVKLYWEAEKLEGRIPDMTEMTEQYMSGVPLGEINIGYDPFAVSPQDIDFGGSVFGQCTVMGQTLYHLLDIDEHCPVYDLKGVQSGTLHVKIVPKLLDESLQQDEYETMEEILGNKLAWDFSIVAGAGVPRKYSKGVYCTYTVPFDGDTFQTEHVDGIDPVFNYRKDHEFIATKENSRQVQDYSFALFLYGSAPSDLQTEAIRKLETATTQPDQAPGVKQPKAPAKPDPKPEPRAEPEPKPEPKPEPRAEPKAEPPRVEAKPALREEEKTEVPARPSASKTPPMKKEPVEETKAVPRTEAPKSTSQFESKPSPFSTDKALPETVTGGRTASVLPDSNLKQVESSKKSGCCLLF